MEWASPCSEDDSLRGSTHYENNWLLGSIVIWCAYGRKSVDRIATQSMFKICHVWRLIVVDCDYAESYGQFLSGRNPDAVYIVPDDS